MADGKKNRFSALAGKDKCEETECQLFEKTVAEAVEEALNKENDQKLTVSAKQPAKGKKKTGPPATTPTGAGDGAMIGDIIVQVIAAIQPVLIKSMTTAVTVAVATAFKQMQEELQAVETMKGEVERVRETWRDCKRNYRHNISTSTDRSSIAARTVSEFTTYPYSREVGERHRGEHNDC